MCRGRRPRAWPACRWTEVDLHVTLLGGGFGRRLEVDYVAQAVRVAMDCAGRAGAADLVAGGRHDPRLLPAHACGPAARRRWTARASRSSLQIKSAGDAISPRWMERGMPALAGPVDLPDKTTAEGLFDQPYGFARPADGARVHAHGRAGGLLALGRPFAQRLLHRMLHGRDRGGAASGTRSSCGAALLKRRAAPPGRARAGGASRPAGAAPLPAGRARGVALHESLRLHRGAGGGGLASEAAQPRVHRVVCAIDCGTVVNPDIVAQQMESSVVFGADRRAARTHRHPRRRGAAGELPRLPHGHDWPHAPQVETWHRAQRAPAGRRRRARCAAPGAGGGQRAVRADGQAATSLPLPLDGCVKVEPRLVGQKPCYSRGLC